MTAAVAGAREGRPSNAGLRESLEATRTVNSDLRDALRAERLDGIELARRCVELGTRLESAGRALGSPTVMQAGLELGYAGTRFLRQRSSGTL